MCWSKQVKQQPPPQQMSDEQDCWASSMGKEFMFGDNTFLQTGNSIQLGRPPEKD